MKLIKHKDDIDLLKTQMFANLHDDEEGWMGIATHFVNQKKAAQILGISIPTLRKYVRLGFITRFKVKGRVYYRIEELENAKQNIF